MHKTNSAVHLWTLNDQSLNCPFLLKKLYGLLSSDEKDKLEKFVMPKKKHQFLIVRAVTRQLLSLYTKTPARRLQFSVNSNGKPYLVNQGCENPIFFNISHTEKMIVWAISREHEVGVDVEYTPKKRNVLGIAQNVFSTKEVDELQSLPPAERNEKFFELWTLKEAYIKAHGLSLTTLLTNNSFLENIQCHFWHIKPNNTHKIAVVVF